ncbi:MAG: hypothetical protein HYV07_00640 [Deltaproteobacteria bacterium]|nr:hypothetical protein [Deltaproteobacteria bacterium]
MNSRLLALLVLASCDPPGLARPNPNFRVIGHRGAPTFAVENTIESFEVAIALGANAIETDVCLTKDDVFVIWHDADPDSTIALARQSGAEGLAYFPITPAVGNEFRKPVLSLTLEELRAHYGYASAGSGQDDSAHIPTVTEVLNWARGEERLRWIYFDMKVASEDHAARFVREVSPLLLSPDFSHLTPVFLHVRPEVVRSMQDERVRQGGDRFAVAWDHEQPGARENSRGLSLRHLSLGLTPSFTYSAFKRDIAEIVDAREHGLIDSVTLWTFDEPSKLAELLYYSVDGVMTNDPGVLHRMWLATVSDLVVK